MTQKNGSLFLMAIGFFLIAISPTMGNKYLNILSGLSLVLLGLYLIKKKK
ncbi:hypothetical protein [Streptococcus marimammalium]|nr:hypothetical protein [Streptococcus marimammalium]